MDTQELANALFGASRIENTSPKTMTTLQGVAVSDSMDGKVKVKLLNAESVPEEEDATEENTVVELLTTPAVKEGDTVVVTAEGGVLKTMSVTGNYGSGDKQTADTEEAKKVATNYIDIDENKGITVGNMQDDTLGHNTYIDANGVSIRDGETVLASFEDDEIVLGKNSETATISLCNNMGKLYCYTSNDTKHFGVSSSTGSFSIHQSSTTQTERQTITEASEMAFNNKGFQWTGHILRRSIYGLMTTTFLNFLTYDGQGLKIVKTNNASVDSPYFEIVSTKGDGYIKANNIYQGDTKVSVEGHAHTSSDFETVLYSDATGTTGDVTLSESITGFTYLEIYYNDGDVYSSEKVNVADVARMIVELSNSSNEVEGVVVADTTITRGADAPVYSITRVVGIK